MTGRLARASLAALSLALALVAAELFLRTFAPQPLGLSYRRDDGLVLHVPNVDVRIARDEFAHRLTTNALGLRDAPVRLPKPDGTFRILLLGDSYAEAYQVPLEEAFSELLEGALNQRFPDRRWEVVNGGVSGYGTGEELRFYETLGRELDPDLVVLSFSAGNDLDDNVRSRFFGWKDGALQPRNPPALSPRQTALLRVKERLASRFHLYQFLRDRYHMLRWIGLARRSVALQHHRAGVFAAEWDPAFVAAWDKTAALLERLRSRIAADGLPLLVVAIPLRMQVDDEEWNTFVAQTEESLDREGVQRRLTALMSERAVPFLDLLPVLREAHRLRRTYYRIDGHFNAHGHEVAAAAILEALLSIDLLPDAAGRTGSRLHLPPPPATGRSQGRASRPSSLERTAAKRSATVSTAEASSSSNTT